MIPALSLHLLRLCQLQLSSQKTLKIASSLSSYRGLPLYRYVGVQAPLDERHARVVRLSQRYPCWGYRKIHVLQKAEVCGLVVNGSGCSVARKDNIR